jgi:poly [ADP-ribose] polymerase 2/3/4
MLIPQDIGRRKPEPRELYPDLDAVQQQSAILDALEASLAMILARPPVEGATAPEPQVFQAQLNLLADSTEYERIRTKYRETRQSLHAASSLDVRRVFRVEIEPMRRAFENYGLKIGNVWELWHGTRVGNLLSILKSGFVIPPAHSAHCTGRLLGNGVYLSDQSTKSLNYSFGYWSGGRDDTCYMFLVNVAMGRSYSPRGTGESLPRPGYDSVFARGGRCGSLINNEMVVYDTRQTDPVYLVEFTRGGR